MVSIYEKEKFLEAYEKAKAYCSENPTIGILSEKIMHLTLKYYFSPFDSDHEVKLGGFYADAVNEDGIVEVQTRSFKNLKEIKHKHLIHKDFYTGSANTAYFQFSNSLLGSTESQVFHWLTCQPYKLSSSQTLLTPPYTV